MTGIYAIHNKVNNKYYIGQAVDINARWIQHRSRLKCQTHENKHLQASYNKYSKEAFEYIVIEECLIDQLDEREMYYVSQYDAYTDGYNQDLGGAGCKGYKHTDEEILKMRMVQNPKEVLQLDMDLNIVGQWISCSHAGKTLGLSTRGIKAVCDRVNRQKTIGGYFWVYKEEYDNNIIDWNYYLINNAEAPKRVSQYSIDMSLIKIWDSISQVHKELGYNATQISKNCRFKSKTAYNYLWRFTDEYTKEQYDKDCNTKFMPTPNKKARKIIQYDMGMNIVRTWNSSKAIQDELGWSRKSIIACCKGEYKTSHGYVWKYADNNSISL